VEVNADFESTDGSSGTAAQRPYPKQPHRLFWDASFGGVLGAAHAMLKQAAAGAVAAAATAAGGLVIGDAQPDNQQQEIRQQQQQQEEEGQVVELVVAYLTSYEHMGRARFSCASGCTCAPSEADAHHADRTSVSATAVLPVRSVIADDDDGGGGGGAGGLARCVLRVEVLEGTSSGEHKFKVIQVVSRAKEVFLEGAPQPGSAPGEGGGGGGGGGGQSSGAFGSGGGGGSNVSDGGGVAAAAAAAAAALADPHPPTR